MQWSRLSRVLLLRVGLLVLICQGTAFCRERKGTPPPPPPPPAEEATPTGDVPAPPADAPAPAHVRYARQLFAHEDYATAGQELELAFAADPVPLYLFNAGQSYRKGGKLLEAKRVYQKFLALDPNNVLVSSVHDYIRTIDLMIEQQEQTQQIGFALEQTLKDLQQARKGPPVYKRAWFWVSLAGVAATAVAVGVGVKLYNDQRASDASTLGIQF